MKRAVASTILALLCGPVAAFADDALTDGTYTVKVQRVVDAKHIVVSTDGGKQATLAAGRDTLDFTKVKPNDQLRLSLVNGGVMVFIDMTPAAPAVAQP